MEPFKHRHLPCKSYRECLWLSHISCKSKAHLLACGFILFIIIFCTSKAKHFSYTSPSTVASRLLFDATQGSYFPIVSPSNKWLASQLQEESVEFNDNLPDDMHSCDIFDGAWIMDDSDPMYSPGTCPFIEDSFNCFKNGRTETGYLNYKWQPNHCEIPRFNGTRMLEMLRGKRLVFVGDSLNRNMWESLACSLRGSLPEKNKLETSDNHEFKSQGISSFKIIDYGCSIDFVKSPFLVQDGGEGDPLRLDVIHNSSALYSDADIIIFNTGHWWTHHKASKGEGSHVYGGLEISEAYRKALNTWAEWIDLNINSSRTRVFFRGYSSSHFRKGKWNTGGHCHGEIEPILNETMFAPYPWMMSIVENVISKMKTPVVYLNVTRMTDYRKDGHPSVYRPLHDGSNVIQDCSHWCLPGVPDFWNHLFYVTLLKAL